MKKSAPNQTPRFFLQGVLILLPVLLLAVFGFIAIVRDRAAVEEEARQRANEILRQITTDLAFKVGSQLAEGFGTRNWFLIPVITNAFDLPPVALNSNGTENLAPASSKFETQILMEQNGKLRWPRLVADPPDPPSWLVSFSKQQREAWTKFTESARSSSDRARAKVSLHEFSKSNPPAAAQANAQFILLREGLIAKPSLDAMDQLLTFAGQHSNVQSEAGLPLASLALASAMDFAKDETGISKILNVLAEQISNHPSVIDRLLLKNAERLCSTNLLSEEAKEKLNTPLSRIKKAFENYEQLRGLAEIYLQKTVTNKYWIQSRQRKFFCLSQLRIPAFMSGGKISYANFEGISVRFLPKQEIRRAFEKVILDKRISLPNYFSLMVELEGEPLPLTINAATNFSAPVLTEATEEMTLFPKMSKPKFTTRWSGAHNVVTLNFEGDAPSKSAKFLFEQADFALRIHLADRHLLLAEPRYRSFLFGVLIAFSVVVALVGFVSARRAFHRQLRLNELKSNFVSSVSHELRAPIASVRLLAESLERGKISEPRKQSEYFKFIVQECRRLSSLIENVLDFSRIEQGRKEYEFEPTDVVKLVRETAKLMVPYAAEKNVNLVLELNDAQLSPEDSQPTLDGHAIQQALVNLIDNAIKHSPANSIVTIGLCGKVLPSCTPQNRQTEAERAIASHDIASPTPELPGATRQHVGGCLQIYVEDSGPGIAPNEHEKIFQRFYRLGSELRRETQGVGIGLSIVKHIVEAHGGKVFVASEPGKGSRFTIELGSTRVPRVRKDEK